MKMKKIPYELLSPADRMGISKLWRKGGHGDPLSFRTCFGELKKILEQLDCVNEFVNKGTITEIVRKKIFLTLELSNGKTEECDAYLDTKSSRIMFFPSPAINQFKKAIWYRIEGILEDLPETIHTAKSVQKIEEELFPAI
jgi:hypothetical protein